MRVLAAALAVLLLVAICSLAEADPSVPRSAAQNGAGDTTCCFSYVSRLIPRSMISSAFKTSNSCPQPAVVLVTRRGTKVCANPSAPWVQEYLKEFQ